MSLYAEYLRETKQRRIVETPEGFATYEFGNGDCYIVDIYCVPEARSKGVAASLADQIAADAKLAGCSRLVGSVNTGIEDPTRSMKVLLAYGMKFIKAEPRIIWFGKDLT